MNDTLLLKPPRDMDPLDGTEGELRRLTRHLLTLVVRYRGRVSLPRNRKPFERLWQVGINGDMHTISHDLGPRGEWSRGGVVITDPLGRPRRYEVLLSRKGFDALLTHAARVWQQTALGTWQPTETATTAIEWAPPGDGWRLAYITLVPGTSGLHTFTWSRVRVSVPTPPHKTAFGRWFADCIDGLDGAAIRELERRRFEHTPITDVDFAQQHARATR